MDGGVETSASIFRHSSWPCSRVPKVNSKLKKRLNIGWWDHLPVLEIQILPDDSMH